MPFTQTGGLQTTQNKGAYAAAGTGTAEKILVDYKDALVDYKATDLPVIAMFAETMNTDTGGDIDISFALPSMKMESIDEGSTPTYQHTKMRSERVSVKEWGIAVGVTRRMIEDSRFNELELALNEARKAVDRHITDHFIKAVFGVADTTYGTVECSAAGGDYNLESEIKNFSNNPSGGFLGTPAAGSEAAAQLEIEADGSRVYPYAGATATNLARSHYITAQEGSGDGELALNDLLLAIDRIGQHGYSANTMLISPGHFNSLLKLADFTAVFTAGVGATTVGSGDHAKQANLQGTFLENTNQTRVVGNIYGLNIISNPWVPADKIMITDSSVKPVAYVQRRGLTVEEANPGFGIVGSYLSMRYGLKIINPLSSVIIENQ
jgi:hypothetical protein